MAASQGPKAAMYKIGTVARMLGTSVSTLRHYEREGLLTPQRSARGTRQYNEAEVARFKVALQLTDVGIPLSEVVDLAQARAGAATGDEASRKILSQLSRLRDQVECRRAQLNAALACLGRAASIVALCANCQNEPTNAGCPNCPSATRFDESGTLALTWSVRE